MIKEKNKWVAQITIDYKTKRIGGFNDKNDAITARLKAEKEYFGEFAPQKELFDKYNI